jgi:hypothetical protein
VVLQGRVDGLHQTSDLGPHAMLARQGVASEH